MPLASEHEREIPNFNEEFAGGSYTCFIGISYYTKAKISWPSSPANNIEIL